MRRKRRKLKKKVSEEGEAVPGYDFGELKELPLEVRKQLRDDFIDPAAANENFHILLNILVFKKKRDPELLKKLRNLRSKKAKLYEHGALSSWPETEKEPYHGKTNFPNIDAAMLEVEQNFVRAEPTNRFSLLCKIGKGSFGQVYKALDDEENCKEVAIKVFRKLFSEGQDSILRELALLSVMRHPNILNLYCTYCWKDYVWAVTEFCDGGTLRNLLDNLGALSEPHIAFVCKCILQALAFLHERGWIHRDVKSSNILLMGNGDVRLADFGLCADVRSRGPLSSMVGSPYWMAPEMIKRHFYCCKVDSYSLGAVTWEMLKGLPPYRSFTSIKALFLTATQGPPELEANMNVSPLLKRFLQATLDVEPLTRQSSLELLQHPFLEKCSSLEPNSSAPPIQTSSSPVDNRQPVAHRDSSTATNQLAASTTGLLRATTNEVAVLPYPSFYVPQ